MGNKTIFSKNYCVDAFVRLLDCCCLLPLEFFGVVIAFCPLVFEEPLPDFPAAVAFPFAVVAFVAFVFVFVCCGACVLFFTEVVPEPPLARFDNCHWFLVFLLFLPISSCTKSINVRQVKEPDLVVSKFIAVFFVLVSFMISWEKMRS